MNIKNLALVLGAAMTVAAGGMTATACSSSSNPVASGGKDAGPDTSTTGDGGEGDSASGGDTGTPPPPTDGGCKAPPTLHVTAAGTIYCGYDVKNCMPGQECCIGGSLGGGMYAPDQCSAWNTACTNPTGKALQVLCDQPGDCTYHDAGAAGAVSCCLQGADAVMQTAGCPGDYISKGGTGSTCEQSPTCATGEIQLCQQDSDCPTGDTCQAFRWKIIQLGYCVAGTSSGDGGTTDSGTADSGDGGGGDASDAGGQ